MKRYLLLILLIFISSFALFAQKIIEGQVLDQSSNFPIAFANIGIQNTRYGTVSEEDGSFSLEVPEGYLKDTISFSAIGFSSRRVPILFFQNDKPSVLLKERLNNLDEIVVKGKREKNQTFELGNMQMRGGLLEADTTYSGTSYALLIENTGPKPEKDLQFPIYLDIAELRILRSNLPSFKIRLRILEQDPITGLPGADLMRKSLVQESDMRNGWMSFDLSDQEILIEKPFFVVFEPIISKQDKANIAQGYENYIERYPNKLVADTVMIDGEEKITFDLKGGIDLPGTFVAMTTTPKALEKYKSYSRESSFAEWERQAEIITARVTLTNQLGGSELENIKKPCDLSPELCEARLFLTDFMDVNGISGGQFSVSQNGTIIETLSLGLANEREQIPVNDSTRFRINSISKSMTSLGLMKLVEMGKLDLDAPVQQYVPSFPEKKYPISSRQLAAHLGGIRDYLETDLSDYIRNEHYNSAAEAVSIFANDSLVNEPGTAFFYSTFGWNLLGAVIEGISAESYLDYMQREVYAPLGMSHTLADDKTKPIPNVSSFYDLTGAESMLGDQSYKYAGGGWLSTSEDLVKAGNELYLNKVIPEETKSIFLENQQTQDGESTGYGLGWYIDQDQKGRKVWQHAGDSFDSSSFLWVFPESGLVIAVLFNSQYGTLFEIEEFSKIFLKE